MPKKKLNKIFPFKYRSMRSIFDWSNLSKWSQININKLTNLRVETSYSVVAWQPLKGEPCPPELAAIS